MPYLKDYHIFISHAWKYGDEYKKVVKILDEASNMKYKDYSAPREYPLKTLDEYSVNTRKEIEDALDRKVSPSGIVLVIGGMYYNYREWMQYEIDVAEKYKKPIIIVQPWGAKTVPVELQKYDSVGFRSDSIVSAIRAHSL